MKKREREKEGRAVVQHGQPTDEGKQNLLGKGKTPTPNGKAISTEEKTP